MKSSKLKLESRNPKTRLAVAFLCLVRWYSPAAMNPKLRSSLRIAGVVLLWVGGYMGIKRCVAFFFSLSDTAP